MRFDQYLRNVQSKEHVYPPLELYRPLDFQTVEGAWRDFGANHPRHPAGIYVHIPFCERKCTFCYCDTIISGISEQHDAYVDALCHEADSLTPALAGVEMRSLYLGGGTPTYLSLANLERLFRHLRARFRFAPEPFVNVESTPRSMTREVATLLASFGTTRVTLGIQSNDPAILNRVNRAQSMDDIERAVTALRDAGIAVLNFDLVAGLEGDTVETFRANLALLLQLGPDMVHVYPFSERGGLAANPEKEAIQRAGEEMLREAGLPETRNDGFGRGPHARNLQVIDKIEEAASCLGLGIRSRSHVFQQLAYRSSSLADFLAAPREQRPPSYLGAKVTKRIQIQKYLMDNMKQGADPRRFQRIFGVPLLPVIQDRFPDVVPLLQYGQGGDIALRDEFRAGHRANALFFEPTYRDRLYSEFVRQPAGVPANAPSWEPDLNWSRYLALILTRSNVYPPKTGPTTPITHDEMCGLWRDHTSRVRAGEVIDKNGIYVHVPYCSIKCNFCYCYTEGGRGQEEIASYAQALMRQMRSMSEPVRGLRFNSIYYGGGTPTIFDPKTMDELLATMYDCFETHDGYQFNCEATPNTLARGRLEVLVKHRVNRLTMGIQSLDRKVLGAIDRAQQTPKGVEDVFMAARKAGIASINLDLVAGLPEQTYESFVGDLTTVLSWRPDVLHVYPFTNMADTLLYQSGYRMSEEAAHERGRMMQYANDAIRAAGYEEVKNEAWALREDARNVQEADKIEWQSSVLALGYQSRGHVFSAATYGSLPEKYQAFMKDPEQRDVYYGTRITKQDAMARYLIASLPRDLDRVRFHDLFGEDVLERFWPQFAWMHRHGLVEITRTAIHSRIKRSIDHIVYAKLFFAEPYQEALRKENLGKYDPAVDYEAKLRVSVDENF